MHADTLSGKTISNWWSVCAWVEGVDGALQCRGVAGWDHMWFYVWQIYKAQLLHNISINRFCLVLQETPIPHLAEVDWRWVSNNNRVEKLHSHVAVLRYCNCNFAVPIAPRRFLCMFVCSTLSKGLCIPFFPFFSKILLHWCNSCPQSKMLKSYVDK